MLGRRVEGQSFEFTDVDNWTGIVFDVDMEGNGTKGELRLLIGKNKVGKVVPIGVWITHNLGLVL